MKKQIILIYNKSFLLEKESYIFTLNNFQDFIRMSNCVNFRIYHEFDFKSKELPRVELFCMKEMLKFLLRFQ